MFHRIQIVGPLGRKEFSYISVSFYIKTLIIITIIGGILPSVFRRLWVIIGVFMRHAIQNLFEHRKRGKEFSD